MSKVIHIAPKSPVLYYNVSMDPYFLHLSQIRYLGNCETGFLESYVIKKSHSDVFRMRLFHCKIKLFY